MENMFSRTVYILGKSAVERLNNSHVILFGIGGVGSYTAEALVRSGIGYLTLYDADRVNPSNINRQLIALNSTVGNLKTDAAETRYNDINPDLRLETHSVYISPETFGKIDFSDCDYIIDAIDNITAKLLIIQEAVKLNIPIISCMGTGNKIDPGRFKIADISKTSVCPLARIMRRELRTRGIYNLKVLYSDEKPVTPVLPPAIESNNDKRPIGSLSFVPGTAGLMIAGEVIRTLSGLQE